jgi:hypothetical protein
MDRFVAKGIVLASLLLACPAISRTQAATNITVVTSLSELTMTIDVAYTSSPLARVVLPGAGTYTNHLGVIGYASGFDSNFLANLPPVTNQGIQLRHVSVEESDSSPRERFYISADAIAIHTTTVGIANYPTNWIQSTYGTCPAWLTGTARTQWFAERDPSRQITTFFLIGTSDIPAWCAAMTNLGHSIPSSDTNLTFLQAYSNDIALAWTPGSTSPDLLVHAPTTAETLDVYVSTNLLDMAAWRLYATLEHAVDPLGIAFPDAGPMAFFTAGDPALDTDADGLSDTKEFFLTGTDPTLRDTVGDGLGDGARILTYGLSATSPDTDGDGLSDAYEIAAGLSPSSTDTDGDGLSDYAEVVTYFGYTFATNADCDADGLNDYQEIVVRNTYAAPYLTTKNPAADTDNDGLSDTNEVVRGTNPHLMDSDGDGMPDKFEVDHGLNPLNAADAGLDPDGDGFNNLTEYKWNYNPTVSNTYSSSYVLITQGPGSNEVISTATGPHDVHAMGDLGPFTSLIRIPPQRFGTNLIQRQLAHAGTAGFRINGAPAPTVASPIAIPAATTALEFRVTADAGYAGSSIGFTLQDTSGGNHGAVTFYSPKVTTAEFRAMNGGYATVGYANDGVLWYPMPADTNSCRIHIYPNISPDGTYTSTRLLSQTDWLRARVYGPGATPSDTTLNQLDWRSAFVQGATVPRNRGIKLSPGVHTVQVGIDANADGVLDPNEVHASCKVYVPRIDLAMDCDNDGSITTNDTQVEDSLPGKLIFKDKDFQATTLSNDSDVVAMDVTFDMGSPTVPDGCYAVLEWIPQEDYETVEAFLDPLATNQLSWTGFHSVYSNQTIRGHLFDAGDTVPTILYLKASLYALAPIHGDDTITHGTVKFICYRRDTKTEVCRDTIAVSVANRPAVTPKNDKFYIWAEERTETNSHKYASWLWDAVETNLATSASHSVPFRLKDLRSINTNQTVEDFLSLREAAILVTSHHGGPGYIYPVSFPLNEYGRADAQTWASQLGTNFAEVLPDNRGLRAYVVAVKSSYFATNWKSQRDGNNAMFWGLCCSGALSNDLESLPSVICAVGGAFACGSITDTLPWNVYASSYSSCLLSMRTEKWRTANAACRYNQIYGAGFTNVGSGRLTLWPAPLRNSSWAAYPKSHCTNGVAMLVLDTVMRGDTDMLRRLGGDARMVGTPQWILRGTDRCGIRWPYINDTSSYPTRLRAEPTRCLATPWASDDKKKMLAGDGMSCGQKIEWEF